MAINKANIALKDDATAGYKNVTAAPISKTEDNTTKKEIVTAVEALESEKFTKSDNLSDGDSAAIKSNLGLDNVDNTADVDKPLSQAVIDELAKYLAKSANLSDGDAAAMKANLSLENVENTADADKPVSTAVNALLSNYLTIAAYNTLVHYRGVYATIGALNTAVPSANAGDYANVDAGVGSDVERYIWDADDNSWVKGGGQSANTFSHGLTDTEGFIEAGGAMNKALKYLGNYYSVYFGDYENEDSPINLFQVNAINGFEVFQEYTKVLEATETSFFAKAARASFKVENGASFGFRVQDSVNALIEGIYYRPGISFELGETHTGQKAANLLRGIWRYQSNQSITDPKDIVHKLHMDNAIQAAITAALSNYVTTTQYNSDKKFRGSYTSLANLNAAVPSGTAGDYADVDAGTGSNAQRYIWDVNDAIWVKSEAGAGGAQSVNGVLPDGAGNIALALAQLNGITLTNLQTGDVIRFNGTEFENVAGETLYSSPLNKDASEALGSSIDFSAANFQPKTLADTTTINSIANPSLGVIVVPITGGNSVSINPALIPAERVAGSFNPAKSTNILKIVCFDTVAPSYYAIWDLEGGGGGSAYLSADKVSSQAPTTSISDIINYEALPILKGDSDVVFDNTAGTFTLKANKDYEIVVSGNYVADSGSTRSTIEMFLTDSANNEIWNAGVYIRDAGDKALISFNRPIKVGASDLTIKFRHIIAKGGGMPINLTKLNITIRS